MSEPMRPLENVRVLEVGRRLGVASAGLALASLGADVVQVRVPGRDLPAAERAYYDRGRTVVADDDELAALGRRADVLLADLADDELTRRRLPAGEADLRGGPGAQVLVTVRSFGRWGPNAHFRTTDLTEWAAGGLAQVTRRPHPPTDPERYTPVLPPGCQPQALAGLAAATAALVARRWAAVRAAPVVADVSVQEVVAALLHGIFPHFAWYGIVLGHPSTPAASLGMLVPALDGDVYIRTLDPRQWDALMEWIGDPAIAALGPDPDARLANNDALCLLIGEWTAKRLRAELLEEGQRRRIPIALPRSMDDVLAWQHLRARGVWREVDFGGRATEAPRLPLLEPPSWKPTTAETVAAVAARWEQSA